MALVKLPSVKEAKSLEEVIDAVENMRKQIEFLFANIENDNINGVISANKIMVGNGTVFESGFDPNGKNKIFISQPVPPYNVGDLWVQGASGDIMRCQTDRATGSYNAADWVKAAKYTDDTKANQVGTYIDGNGIYTGKIVASQIQAGDIDGNNINIANKLTMKQSSTSSGFYITPIWSGATKSTMIGINSVTNGGLADETHYLSIIPNLDNPYNGSVSIGGNFNTWDRLTANYNMYAAPQDFTRKGLKIPFGQVGSSNCVYQDASNLHVRVNLSFPSIPYVICTPHWTSGAVSTTYTLSVWAENVSTSGFDLYIRDPGGHFNSSSYIWVDWFAICYDQTYT
jgi:hypothetical protein